MCIGGKFIHIRRWVAFQYHTVVNDTIVADSGNVVSFKLQAGGGVSIIYSTVSSLVGCSFTSNSAVRSLWLCNCQARIRLASCVCVCCGCELMRFGGNQNFSHIGRWVVFPFQTVANNVDMTASARTVLFKLQYGAGIRVKYVSTYVSFDDCSFTSNSASVDVRNPHPWYHSRRVSDSNLTNSSYNVIYFRAVVYTANLPQFHLMAAYSLQITLW